MLCPSSQKMLVSHVVPCPVLCLYHCFLKKGMFDEMLCHSVTAIVYVIN